MIDYIAESEDGFNQESLEAYESSQPTLAQKFDQQKPRMDLLDPYALREVAKVLGYGAEKYEPSNWRKGMAWGRMYAAALRHLITFWEGEDVDPESGLSHLAHAACGVMFLIWYEKERKEFDDRWKG